ncbi:glycerol-3-phosphate 1-O-acyltransferase PlsY [bacterium]|nr:glycerol-3-phosphate 1-O-acyltransferase PlsY [bacterium]
MILYYIALILFCYLMGAIPFSYITVKLFLKKDIREIGSGNVGATNAFRAGGVIIGIISLILDALKAVIPLFLIKNNFFIHNLQFEYPFGFAQIDFLLILSIFILIGHIYTVFLRFKGGKGVAVSLGITIFLFPKLLLIALAVFILVFVISHIISISSISAAITLIPLIFIFETTLFSKIILLLLIFFIIIRHKNNIKRLLKKEEKKLF